MNSNPDYYLLAFRILENAIVTDSWIRNPNSGSLAPTTPLMHTNIKWWPGGDTICKKCKMHMIKLYNWWSLIEGIQKNWNLRVTWRKDFLFFQITRKLRRKSRKNLWFCDSAREFDYTIQQSKMQNKSLTEVNS